VTYQQLKDAMDKIRQWTRDSNYTFPQDFGCWLLLGEFNCGDLYGSYSFYDHIVVLKALTLDEIILLFSKLKNISPGLIPFAGRSPQKMHFIVQKPQKNYLQGQIVTTGLEDLFPVAESFEAFLKHHITQLEIGNYRLREGRICLFPRLNISTAVTNQVKISASPLFIPERSKPGQYLWAYSITISMDKNTPSGFDCILRSRHWEITSVGRTEVVDGAGVIGYYPSMTPGAEFIYESCCPLVDNNGTMKGSFQMKRAIDGQTFDAIVPVFNFTVPPMIKMSDLIIKEVLQQPNNL